MLLEWSVPILKRFVTVSLVALIFVFATGRAQLAPAAQQAAAPQNRSFGDPSGGYTGFPLPDQPQVFTSAATSYRVTPTKGLVRPWALAFLPNADILITERTGHLRMVRNGVLDPQEITGIPPVLHHRAFGLMDVALHPRFAENHLVYFTYSKPKAGETEVAAAALLRARYDGGHSLSEVQDLFVSNAFTDQASQARIVFGRDGKIYMSIGMTHPGKFGSAQDAQDPASHGGKILRLNDDGSAPPDNPFAGRPGYKPDSTRSASVTRSACRSPPDRRALGHGEWAVWRRRGQHHPSRKELWLARGLLRPVLQRRAHRRDGPDAGRALLPRDGTAVSLLEPVDCRGGHRDLHRRPVSAVEGPHLRRGDARQSPRARDDRRQGASSASVGAIAHRAQATNPRGEAGSGWLVVSAH